MSTDQQRNEKHDQVYLQLKERGLGSGNDYHINKFTIHNIVQALASARVWSVNKSLADLRVVDKLDTNSYFALYSTISAFSIDHPFIEIRTVFDQVNWPDIKEGNIKLERFLERLVTEYGRTQWAHVVFWVAIINELRYYDYLDVALEELRMIIVCYNPRAMGTVRIAFDMNAMLSDLADY